MTVIAPDQNPEVASYLAEVAAHLSGISEAERDDLLDDLAHHLAEVAAEPGPPLAERLGSPADYAAELIASAGVTAPTRTRRSLRSRWAAVAAMPQYDAAVEFLVGLRPAWWVARGFLAGWYITDISGWPERSYLVLPSFRGNGLAGFLIVVACIAGSIAVGRKRLNQPWRTAVVVANVALLFFGMSLASKADHVLNRSQYVYMPSSGVGADNCLRDRRGQPIQNLYAYDAEGRPIDRATIYDQDGQPIDNLCLQGHDNIGRPVATEYATDANGRRVVNVFPRKQTTLIEPAMPGTTPSTMVAPPPAIAPPRLAATTTTTTSTTSTTSTTTPTTTPPP